MKHLTCSEILSQDPHLARMMPLYLQAWTREHENKTAQLRRKVFPEEEKKSAAFSNAHDDIPLKQEISGEQELPARRTKERSAVCILPYGFEIEQIEDAMLWKGGSEAEILGVIASSTRQSGRPIKGNALPERNEYAIIVLSAAASEKTKGQFLSRVRKICDKGIEFSVVVPSKGYKVYDKLVGKMPREGNFVRQEREEFKALGFTAWSFKRPVYTFNDLAQKTISTAKSHHVFDPDGFERDSLLPCLSFLNLKQDEISGKWGYAPGLPRKICVGTIMEDIKNRPKTGGPGRSKFVMDFGASLHGIKVNRATRKAIEELELMVIERTLYARPSLTPLVFNDGKGLVEFPTKVELAVTQYDVANRKTQEKQEVKVYSPLCFIPLDKIDDMLGEGFFFPGAGEKDGNTRKSRYMLDVRDDGTRLPIVTTSKEAEALAEAGKPYVHQMKVYGAFREWMTQWMKLRQNRTDMKSRHQHKLDVCEFVTSKSGQEFLPSRLCGIPIWLQVVKTREQERADEDDPPSKWIFGTHEELDACLEELASSRKQHNAQDWLENDPFDREEFELASEEPLDYIPPSPLSFDPETFYVESERRSMEWHEASLLKKNNERQTIEKELESMRATYRQQPRDVQEDMKSNAEYLKDVLQDIFEEEAKLRNTIEGVMARTLRRCGKWKFKAERRAEENAWRTLIRMINELERLDTKPIDSSRLCTIAKEAEFKSLYSAADAVDMLAANPRKKEDIDRQKRLRAALERTAERLEAQGEKLLTEAATIIRKRLLQVETIDDVARQIEQGGQWFKEWIGRNRSLNARMIPASQRKKKARKNQNDHEKIIYVDREETAKVSGLELLRQTYAKVLAKVNGMEIDPLAIQYAIGRNEGVALELADFLMESKERLETIKERMYVASALCTETVGKALDHEPELDWVCPEDLGDHVEQFRLTQEAEVKEVAELISA